MVVVVDFVSGVWRVGVPLGLVAKGGLRMALRDHLWKVISHPTEDALYRCGSSFDKVNIAYLTMVGGFTPGTRIKHKIGKKTIYYTVRQHPLGLYYLQRTDANGHDVDGQLWPAGTEADPKLKTQSKVATLL